MKVAQYEVLGWRSKERPVPDGTIDECWQSLSRVRNQKPSVSIVLDPKADIGANGTDLPFASFPSPAAAGLGYFRQVPPGLILSNDQRTCAILIRALMLPVQLAPPCRRPIFSATTPSLYARWHTGAIDASSRDS
jgi:hypothetical protein